MNLKNSQFQTIMRQYDSRQLAGQHTLQLHRQEISEKIPEYAILEEKTAALYASCARAAILGTPVNDIKASIEEYQNRQRQLLQTAGYPEDYLTLTYICPDCKDTGFINGEKCHCFRQAVVDLLYSQSNLHDILKQENFEHFNFNYYSTEINARLGISPRENMQNIVRSCMDFIDYFDTRFRNLLFYGDTGVGKTFLSNCIARELLETSHTVIYLSSFQLVEILQNNTFNKDELDDSGETMYSYVLDCDLLIIDDLGTELNNSFVTSQLFLCINERLNHKKSTIISTNLSLEELQSSYSERIVSRLISNYDIIPIFGDDIRITKAIS